MLRASGLLLIAAAAFCVESFAPPSSCSIEEMGKIFQRHHVANFNAVTKEEQEEMCNNANTVAKCLVVASTGRDDGYLESLKDLQALVEEACLPGSTLPIDIGELLDCLTKNFQNIKGCTLSGDPNNLGELCGIFSEYLQCYTTKGKELCSNTSATLEKLLNPLTKAVTTCSSETDVIFDSCMKGYINCGLQAFGSDIKCTNLEKLANCILKLPPACIPQGLAPITQRYVAQIPDYCNSESPFRKNFDKSNQCILPKLESVKPCIQKLQADFSKLLTSGITDRKELRMKMIRLQQQYISCVLGKVATPCGKEAEFTVKYLFKPMEDWMDETCLELTHKKCNGASGQMSGTWPLLISVMFLLSRYYV